MAEWFKAAVLKTVVLGRVPGVRIPLPPPVDYKVFRGEIGSVEYRFRLCRFGHLLPDCHPRAEKGQMPGKRNKYGLEHGCRTMYGPIQAFVSVTGREDHFLVVLADTRSSKEIENVEADGTLEEAKQYAIKAAARCLRQDVPEWQWGCS
jgi:hypothetical protein